MYIGVLKDGGITVQVYDSLSTRDLHSRTKEQIASICNCSSEQINIDMVDVQQQSDGKDCGLFALAYMTAFCYSQDPSEKYFVHHQLRSHLVECLEKQAMSPFPSRSRNRVPCLPTKLSISIYCKCRLPADDGRMMECTNCNVWYHEECEPLIPEQAWIDKDYPWKCRTCSATK